MGREMESGGEPPPPIKQRPQKAAGTSTSKASRVWEFQQPSIIGRNNRNGHGNAGRKLNAPDGSVRGSSLLYQSSQDRLSRSFFRSHQPKLQQVTADKSGPADNPSPRTLKQMAISQSKGTEQQCQPKRQEQGNYSERESQRPKMSKALVTLMSKLDDPVQLLNLQSMFQRWMIQRCARAVKFAFSHWLKATESSLLHRQRHFIQCKCAWINWCGTIQRSRAVRHFCEQIIHRDAADCFIAWKDQTHRFKVEGKLHGDIHRAYVSLERQVSLLEGVLADDSTKLIRESIASSASYQTFASDLLHQKQALEQQMATLREEVKKEKMRGDWLGKQLNRMAALAAKFKHNTLSPKHSYLTCSPLTPTTCTHNTLSPHQGQRKSSWEIKLIEDALASPCTSNYAATSYNLPSFPQNLETSPLNTATSGGAANTSGTPDRFSFISTSPIVISTSPMPQQYLHQTPESTVRSADQGRRQSGGGGGRRRPDEGVSRSEGRGGMALGDKGLAAVKGPPRVRSHKKKIALEGLNMSNVRLCINISII